jgi:hypothetical protein
MRQHPLTVAEEHHNRDDTAAMHPPDKSENHELL